MKIGIDLGGSHIGVGVIDNKNFIIEKVEKRLLNKDKKDIKSIIESYIIKNVKEFSSKYKITEIGIAVPGTIKKEQILKSVNLGVKEYNLVENLKKEIQLPIKIRNDAKCAALTENTIGALKDYKRSLFLTLGTGIGGAVIINDKLLDTGDLPGCEFGHMVIKRNLRQILGVDEKIRGQELLDIIRKNPKDEKINKVIDEYIEYLSIGISNLINIFEPEAIGIGGSFVYFSDVLLDRLIQNIIKKQYLFNKREELIIIPAALGNDAGIIGSVL